MNVQRNALKELVQSNAELFSLICIFNTDLARIIDPSHISNLVDHHLFEKLCLSKRARQKLSALLLKKFGLEADFCFDFKEPAHRLALLEKPLLKDLLLYAGASYYSGSITHIIQKQEVLELKQGIGEKAYVFALKRAPFLIKSRPELPKNLIGTKATAQNIVKAGQVLFQYCFSGAPFALTERFRLKFDAQLSWKFPKKHDAEKQAQAWNLLHKILTSEIDPHIISFLSN